MVDDDLFVCCAIGYGPELAEAHALSAASAKVAINTGNILGTEHDGDLDVTSRMPSVRTISGNRRRRKSKGWKSRYFDLESKDVQS